MWDDYTLERLPVLRQRWSENMALCESEEERQALKQTMGYTLKRRRTQPLICHINSYLNPRKDAKWMRTAHHSK
jgi:hypothetical protein